MWSTHIEAYSPALTRIPSAANASIPGCLHQDATVANPPLHRYVKVSLNTHTFNLLFFLFLFIRAWDSECVDAHGSCKRELDSPELELQVD